MNVVVSAVLCHECIGILIEIWFYVSGSYELVGISFWWLIDFVMELVMERWMMFMDLSSEH